MKKKKLLYFSLFIIGLICLSMVYFLGRSINMNTVDRYKPYSFKQKTLSNGMTVLLVKDDELPYLSFDIMFKTGSKMDPKNKEGLMSLLVEIIDKGTKSRSAVQVTEDVENLGTSFLYSLDNDSVSFSVETLSWLDQETLEVFSEIITQPAFLKTEFERAKEKSIGWVKRSTENFSSYSNRIFNQYVYEAHPYGSYQNGSIESLKTIQLEDIKKFYDRFFVPEQAVLSVSGRYPEHIMEQLEKAFGKWKINSEGHKKNNNITVSPISSKKNTKLLLVNHEEAIQSEIRIGHISLNRSHKDYLYVTAANVVLGGSFNSRLMKRIRVQKGLTYSIYSYFSAKKELGAFKLGLAVRNKKVGTALLEIIGVLEDFHQNGITEEELKKAKQLLKNKFITNVSTADNFARLLLYLNSQDIPYSYTEEYFEKLDALSLDKINESIKEHLQPNKIKISILTHADKVKSQLKDFGPIMIKSYKDFL